MAISVTVDHWHRKVMVTSFTRQNKEAPSYGHLGHCGPPWSIQLGTSVANISGNTKLSPALPSLCYHSSHNLQNTSPNTLFLFISWLWEMFLLIHPLLTFISVQGCGKCFHLFLFPSSINFYICAGLWEMFPLIPLSLFY